MEQKNDVNPKLPFDILAYIIEIVAQVPNGRVRTSTLSALAQTCSSLLPLCRQKLFSVVSLQPLDILSTNSIKSDHKIPSIDFQTMDRLLKNNPAIADHVHTLHVNLSHDGNSSASVPLDMFNHVQKLVITSFETILSWLHLSPEVLVGDSYEFQDSETPLDWNKISSSLQQSLKRIIYLPTLTTLQLTRACNFPADILLPCTHLRTLYIIQSHLLSISPTPETDSSFTPVNLKTVTLLPGAKSNAQVLCHRRPDGQYYFDMSGIQFINIILRRVDDVPQLGELLKNANHLKLLDITFEDSDLQILSQMVSIPASSWENIRHLALSGPTTRQGEAHWWKTDIYLFEVLKNLSQSFSYLQSLELRFAVFCFPNVEADLFRRLLGLAILLSNAARFSSLKSVIIDMHIIGGTRYLDQIRKQRWCSVLKAQMAIFARNRALYVDLSAPTVLPEPLRSGPPNEGFSTGKVPSHRPSISRPETSASAEFGRSWRARESGLAGAFNADNVFESMRTRGGAGRGFWRLRRGRP